MKKTTVSQNTCMIFSPLFGKLYEFHTGPAVGCMIFELLYEKTTVSQNTCMIFSPLFGKLYEFHTGPAVGCMIFELLYEKTTSLPKAV